VALEPQTHALYRFYGAGGTLLYIGITNSLPRRLRQHNDEKAWWLGVTEVKVEHYPHREAVLEAERRAIKAEKPLYNDKHNRGGLAKAGATPVAPQPDEFWAEGYMIACLHILDSYADKRAAELKKQARDMLAKGAPELADLDINSVMLLGPAATLAFDDVSDTLIGIVKVTEFAYNSLPRPLATELMSATKAELKAKGLGIGDMPRILLGRILLHFGAITSLPDED
jgi:predicted GIY-YIG superfamily endonuclease